MMIRASLVAAATTALVWGMGSPAVQAQTRLQFDASEAPIQLAQRRRGREGDQARWLQELDLTPEQVQEMRAIRERYQPQMETQRETMKAERQALQSLMVGNASEGTIRAQHEVVQDQALELADLRFESMLEIREILTPAQRAQAAELMEERRQNFQEDFLGNP
jgi:Spy/CpxP family protein refolding chaperone